MARKKQTRMQELREFLPPGLYVDEWSPGDGVTRYRFAEENEGGYFGAGRVRYTALGYAEAATFARGAQAGYWLDRKGEG